MKETREKGRGLFPCAPCNSPDAPGAIRTHSLRIRSLQAVSDCLLLTYPLYHSSLTPTTRIDVFRQVINSPGDR
jgi:hypothetical protein